MSPSACGRGIAAAWPIAFVALALPLLGCAGTAKPKPPPPVAATIVPPAPDKPKPKPKRPHKPHVAAAPVALIGLSEAKTNSLLGTPESQVNVGPSQVWTYRVVGCSLTLTFFLDVTDNEYDALSRSITGTDGSEKQAQHCIRQIIAHAKRP
jgi:hypothetical protein